MIVIQNPSRSSQSFMPVQTPLGPVQSQSLPTPMQTARVGGNGPSGAPTHEQIAQCAYDIYLEHGRAEGRKQLDWRQAEEELAQTPRDSWPKAPAHSQV